MAAVQQVVGEAHAKVYQLESRERDLSRQVRADRDLTTKLCSDKRTKELGLNKLKMAHD